MQEILGLGGAPLGNLFAAIADDEATTLVRHAFDRGIRYFDTAPHYGSGLSEHRIGAALRDVPRDAYLLSTKVGRLLTPDRDRAAQPARLRRRAAVRPALGLLARRHAAQHRRQPATARPGADRLRVHPRRRARCARRRASPRRFREAMEGAVPALARLKAEGVIAGFGLGVNDWQVCVDALAHADLDVLLLAGRYTLLDQTALPELLPLCVKRGTQRRGRRSVQFGHSRHRHAIPRTGGPSYFNYAPAQRRRHRARRGDRGRLRRARRAAQGRRAAVSARASGRRVRAGRRALASRSSTRISRWPRIRFRPPSGASCGRSALVAEDAPLPGESRDDRRSRSGAAGRRAPPCLAPRRAATTAG